MSTATLMGRIAMDDSDFQAKIRRATDSGKDFGKQIESSMLGAGRAVKNLVGGFAAFIVARGAVRGLTGAMKDAADFEGLQLDFELFLKDAEKAKNLIAEITKFADATPFEPDELLLTAKNLLGAGVAADRLMGILQDIGAVAKDGLQLQELGDALTKGFAKGKFQTEELNKFLERGVNLLPELAKVTGKTGDELTKAIEKGLRFEDVTAAISALSDEGGSFFGRLEKQSKTASGLASTLSGNWKSFQRQIGAPINDALKPILERAIQLIGEAGPAAGRIGEAMANIVTVAGNFFLFMSEGIFKLGALLEAVFTKAIEEVMLGVLPEFLKAKIGVDGVEARSFSAIVEDIAKQNSRQVADTLAEGAGAMQSGAGAAAATLGAAATKIGAAGKSLKADLDETSIIYSDAARAREFGSFTGSSRLPGLEGGGAEIRLDQKEVVGHLKDLVEQNRAVVAGIDKLALDVS